MTTGLTEYYGITPVQKGAEYRFEGPATAGQTVFQSPYTVGYLDVYKQGLLLASSAYTATDGFNVTLTTPCTGGEIIKIISRGVMPVGQNNSYTQSQSDARFATIANLALKANLSQLTRRGYIYFTGSF